MQQHGITGDRQRTMSWNDESTGSSGSRLTATSYVSDSCQYTFKYGGVCSVEVDRQFAVGSLRKTRLVHGSESVSAWYDRCADFRRNVDKQRRWAHEGDVGSKQETQPNAVPRSELMRTPGHAPSEQLEGQKAWHPSCLDWAKGDWIASSQQMPWRNRPSLRARRRCRRGDMGRTVVLYRQ